MAENVQLAWALEWAKRGFRVFPIAENSKSPLWEGWTEHASRNPVVIDAMWHQETPGGRMQKFYNVGVLTTDLLVVDIDVKGNKDGFGNWLEIDGTFDTLCVKTPSGGYHLYYNPPAPVANSQGERGGLAPGLDVRGYHGYVLAPGSVVDGRFYTLEIDVPVRAAPASVLARCKPPGERIRDNFVAPLVELDSSWAVTTSTEFLESLAPAVKGEGFNQAIFDNACRVRDYGLSETLATELMLNLWNERCMPPDDADRFSAIVSNAYRYAQNPEGWRHPAVGFGNVTIIPPDIVPEYVPPGIGDNYYRFGNVTPLALLKPRPWLIKPLLLLREVTALFAPGGVGKSLTLIIIAIYLALGRPVWGFKNFIGEPRKSVIYNAEDSHDEMSARFYAICVAINVDYRIVAPWVMLVSGRDAKRRGRLVVMSENRHPLRNDVEVQHLISLVSDPLCVFLGLDPLVKLHEMAENDNIQMSYVMEVLEFVAEQANVAVKIAHHTSKPAMSGSSKYAGNADSGRGAGAIKDGVRGAFTLSPPTDDDCLQYGLAPDIRRRMLRFEDANKNNRSLGGDEPTWLEKITVTLPNGEEVGAFVEADITAKIDTLRQHLGQIISDEMSGRSTASLPLTEAIMAIQRDDDLYARMESSAVRTRLERSLVRAIMLDDGTTVTMKSINHKKILVKE